MHKGSTCRRYRSTHSSSLLAENSSSSSIAILGHPIRVAKVRVRQFSFHILCGRLPLPVLASSVIAVSYNSLPMSHPGRLEGKTTIITGAGLGLGEGITRKFVEEGANVLLFEINAENGQKVADSLPKDKAAFYMGDVTNREHWDGALKACIEKFGGCHIVVNNAGVVHRAVVGTPIRSEDFLTLTTSDSPLSKSPNPNTTA